MSNKDVVGKALVIIILLVDDLDDSVLANLPLVDNLLDGSLLASNLIDDNS